MIGRLIISVAILFMAGAVMIVATHILHRPGIKARKQDWLKYGIYILIIFGFLAIAYVGKPYLAILFLMIAYAGGLEIQKHSFKASRLKPIYSAIVIIVIFALLSHPILTGAISWYSEFAFIFLLVCVSDSYSQLWGKLIGRHKLCPRISPGKTREGLIGGWASVLSAALLLRFLIPHSGILEIFIYAMIIALSANAGDLLFSFIKRRLAIKDFSGIIPGHGGILDRFDSLIIAAPVSFWARQLILN